MRRQSEGRLSLLAISEQENFQEEQIMNKEKIIYVEPDDYFPEHIRKECGLGEYAKKENSDSIDESKKDSKKESD